MFNPYALLEKWKLSRTPSLGQHEESSHRMDQYIQVRVGWESEDHFYKGLEKLVATDHPTRGLWFIKFARGWGVFKD